MSKCIFKEIADKLNKAELENYYKTHLTDEVCKHFNFDKIYFYRIFNYLQIPLRSLSETRKLFWETAPKELVNEMKSNFVNHLNGRAVSEETKKKISESNKGKKKHPNNTSFRKGNIPWNKNKKDVQSWTPEQKEKYYNSLAKSNWFKRKTLIEQEVENYLINLFGKDDIEYQYRDKERYPFYCDFYVKSKDLFIEVNHFWTHGEHPFDENNPEDIIKLNDWKEKSKVSPFYKNAIETWTIRDVKKQEYANKHNLNYITIYHKDPIDLITNSLAI